MGTSNAQTENNVSTLGLILLIIVILLLLGAVPRWPHSRNWGYMPSGTLGLVLVIVIVLVLLGRI
jgi:uncharacterized membrane protein YkgB